MAPRSNSTSNRMEQVRTALQTARTGTLRSALYHWMRQNHDSLTALFEESTPAWAILAETFAGMGLNDREGKSPTPRTARMTWYRVRLDVARCRAPRGAPVPLPDVAFVPPTARLAITDQNDLIDEPSSEPEFRFATSPGWSPSDALPDSGRPPVATRPQNADRAIAQLLARPKRGAVPMPDIPEPEEE